MIYFKESSIGRIGIGEKGGSIVKVVFENNTEKIGSDFCDFTQNESNVPIIVVEAFRQLDEYLDGKRREFELPLAPEGTPFMKKVWTALCDIPYGKTATYKDIAIAVGSPKGYRAVGMANNKNPVAVFIPCHRVIGCSGKLVGYAGGMDLKTKLLVLENKQFKES
jgi:O-6-methylguanine DNA methyltransferase